MSSFNCCCRYNCTALAVVVSAILGVLAAFLQITGVITVTDTFLWVVFGIAVVYLGVLVVSAVLSKHTEGSHCVCHSISTILAGILGSILTSVVLLAVGIVATSVISAILVGLLVLFFFLMITATACYLKCLNHCDN